MPLDELPPNVEHGLLTLDDGACLEASEVLEVGWVEEGVGEILGNKQAGDGLGFGRRLGGEDADCLRQERMEKYQTSNERVRKEWRSGEGRESGRKKRGTNLSHVLGSEHDLQLLGISRRVDLDVSLMMLGILLELGTKVRHLVTLSVDKNLRKQDEREISFTLPLRIAKRRDTGNAQHEQLRLAR
jgi:hypothetical protein